MTERVGKAEETLKTQIKEVVSRFEERRRLLLENTAEQERTAEQIASPHEDMFGNRAIANLIIGRHMAAANARLRRTAEWFDHPLPQGKNHQDACTFTAMKLCRAWYLFKETDKIEPATREKIRRFFLTTNFQSMYHSENHHLLWRTSRYLMACVFKDDTFIAWRSKGRQIQEEDRAWLDNFIRFRARRGWGEFDSPVYFVPDWQCLTTLYDYAPDEELKRLAGMMLDLLLLDMAVDSLAGMYCGAHGRIYAPHALDHSTEGTRTLQFLYFGAMPADVMLGKPALVDALASAYRPREIILETALNRTTPYENRERKHLHNVDDVMPVKPLAGSIRKYTWWTPHFAMGCVQRQDHYPADCKGSWYAHHEQHQWDMSFATGTRARIFTHHPGKNGYEHGYWTGDIQCGCGHFFQNRAALVALYDIPEKEPCAFIHAYMPRAEFDELVEENGWIFVRSGEACAALKMMGGHRWAEDITWTQYNDWKNRSELPDLVRHDWRFREVISPGRRNGVVCEAGLLLDFGGFAAFRAEIAANRVDFDQENMRLTYASPRSGELFIDTRGARRLDGKDVDMDYGTYDCPCLKSGWDSGLVTIVAGNRREVLDFRAAKQNSVAPAGKKSG